MTPNASEAGFTLIELLMASVLGSLLMIAAFGMLYDSIRIADVLRSRVQLNAAARESFDILLNGGISSSTEVIGLRGRPVATMPSAAALSDINLKDPTNNNFRVKLEANGATAKLTGPTTVSQNVTCTASEIPIPACQNGITLAVNGYLGGAPRIHVNTREIKDQDKRNRMREIELTLANPYLLSDTADDVTTAQSVEIYRTIFQLNGD